MSELYEKSLGKLELDQVLQLLAECAGSEGGKEACLSLRPSSDLEEVELMQICRDVEGHLSIRAKEQQVKMTLRGESCRIKGARQVLYEMIYNLCDNAIKYNRKDGEVEVTVSRGRNGRAVVSVADTGIGIAKEDQERIFERFYRVDKSHSRETGGTGLGLSIVKHGAILHDAKIKIESTLGTGTKIILEF